MHGSFRKRLRAIGLLWLCSGIACWAAPVQLVDRIVARVQNDIILLSEVRELAAYQQLLDGRSDSQDELVRALVEQWVVRNEAYEAQFPRPSASEIDTAFTRVKGRFASLQAFQERIADLGLSEPAIRRLVSEQLYLSRYLDYKFRPAVQVSDEEISAYYQEELAPALRNKGQDAPPLDEVRTQIRELLVERSITERAAAWFDETKSRLQIEVSLLEPLGRKP
jgi:hypothetical protein